MITIYTIAYNEESFIKFMIDHYRKRFNNCHIVIYDNLSTDNTAKIAKENNCEVIQFDTNNSINDSKYLEIKNNCWKSAKTNWVLICDVDELLDINEENLLNEESNNVSIIQSEGWNMVNMIDDFNCIEDIKYGARHIFSDKNYCFNKNLINEINYEPGCHKSKPIGNIKYSDKKYKCYHFNFLSIKETIIKYQNYAKRLSEQNLKNGWGFHYLMKESDIINEFNEVRKKAIKIL